MMKDRTFPPQVDFSSVIGLASPKDRLAAFILDGVILLPIIQLFQAPFKKGVLEALLYNSESLASQFRLMNMLVILLVFVGYQTTMTYWKGQSLGKMFFHLKVISYQGNLTFYQSFLRNLILILEFLTFGWMWSSVLSHPLRRVFHDRSSDTLVISTKSPASLPSRFEVLTSRALNGFYGFVFLIFVANLSFVAEKGSESSESFVFGGDKCKQTKEKFDDSIEDLIIVHLEKKLSSECLYNLARKKVWNEEDKALSHFAMALALKKTKRKSKKYLIEICRLNKDSSLCKMGRWLGRRRSSETKTVEQLYSSIKTNKKSRLVEVMMALYFEKEKKYQKSLEILSQIEEGPAVDGLKASLVFYSLLHLEKFDEAFWVYQTHNKVSAEVLEKFYRKSILEGSAKIRKHIQFVESLEPELKKRRQVRGLASTPDSKEKLLEIYEELKGRL